MSIRYLVILSGLTLASLAIGESAQSPVQEGRSLREIVQDNYPKNVYIGATTGFRDWDTGTDQILNREFSYITPNNDFKQPPIHPDPKTWRWDIPDEWVVRATQHGQLIRMHGPISPQCSHWAKNDDRTAEELKQNMAEYMTALCKRYNGNKAVRWMDVVNETILKDGSWFGPKPGVKSWENPWTTIGFETNIPSRYPLLQEEGVPLYIIHAFEIAQKHAPDIKLIINQHALIEPEAAAKFKELVLYLRERGLRVDGIGWQAHLSKNWTEWADATSPNYAVLEELITWAHHHSLEFHITENNIHTPTALPYSEEDVAAVYENLIRTLLSRRHSGVVTWNLWNITDRPHWRNPKLKMLGLWDEELNPKPAYDAVRKVLEN